jgi:1,4-dihydroxy-6-naphthoate synthase
MARPNEAIEYAMQFARGQPKELIDQFVRMYVNDVTIEMGILGEQSIRNLFQFGKEKGFVPEFPLRIVKN